MKCTSCEREIDPKWRHAIDTNLCPFCGLFIMEERLKDLFFSLSSSEITFFSSFGIKLIIIEIT